MEKGKGRGVTIDATKKILSRTFKWSPFGRKTKEELRTFYPAKEKATVSKYKR